MKIRIFRLPSIALLEDFGFLALPGLVATLTKARQGKRQSAVEGSAAIHRQDHQDVCDEVSIIKHTCKTERRVCMRVGGGSWAGELDGGNTDKVLVAHGVASLCALKDRSSSQIYIYQVNKRSKPSHDARSTRSLCRKLIIRTSADLFHSWNLQFSARSVPLSSFGEGREALHREQSLASPTINQMHFARYHKQRG